METVTYGQMKHKMRKHEMNLLSKLKNVLSPLEVGVTVLADRGFADTKLYAFILQQNIDTGIRIVFVAI